MGGVCIESFALYRVIGSSRESRLGSNGQNVLLCDILEYVGGGELLIKDNNIR